MTPAWFGAAVTVLLAGIGFVVWLVRLEGKHNVLDAKHDGLKGRVDSLEDRIMRALDRIEHKLDAKADK